jgi:hypothetical protein
MRQLLRVKKITLLRSCIEIFFGARKFTALFLTQMHETMNHHGTFFNVSGPIEKSHILRTQMNEKTCAFNNGRQKTFFV